jgi:hypothetical protein
MAGSPMERLRCFLALSSSNADGAKGAWQGKVPLGPRRHLTGPLWLLHVAQLQRGKVEQLHRVHFSGQATKLLAR